MKTVLGAVSALALAAIALPAAAQEVPAAAQDAPAAREEAAQATVDYLFPEGIYERMMRGTMEQMTGQMMESMMDIPMRNLIMKMDLPEDEVANLGEASMREMMEVMDPHFMERMQLTNSVMMDGMVDVMASMEPAMREGLADAYADKFTAGELNELTAFFATPTGTKYAENAMMIFMDPKMMAKMQESMPKIMEAMPALVVKAQEATAHLPPPRKPEDLTEEEREKIVSLATED